MRHLARIAVVAIVAIAAGCSDSSSKTDGGADGNGNPAGCPAQMPSDGATCSGSLTCEYGQSTCCGMSYSFMTCSCQSGAFSCAQTVECNFVCPDASGG